MLFSSNVIFGHFFPSIRDCLQNTLSSAIPLALIKVIPLLIRPSETATITWEREPGRVRSPSGLSSHLVCHLFWSICRRSLTNFHANTSDIRVHKGFRCQIWLCRKKERYFRRSLGIEHYFLTQKIIFAAARLNFFSSPGASETNLLFFWP